MSKEAKLYSSLTKIKNKTLKPLILFKNVAVTPNTASKKPPKLSQKKSIHFNTEK